jgi:hypothetical protein
MLSDSSNSVDLSASETGYEFGYIYLAILGAQVDAHDARSNLSPDRFGELLQILIARGAPIDKPNIMGYTTLHELAQNAPRPDLVRLLLKNGANINAQDRSGTTPIMQAFQGDPEADLPVIEAFMEYGPNLDIKNTYGDDGRIYGCLYRPEISSTISKWARQGQGAPEAARQEKSCDKCKAVKSGLKVCTRCKVAMYCGPECQSMYFGAFLRIPPFPFTKSLLSIEAHWVVHKKLCKPLDTTTSITIKPEYDELRAQIRTSDRVRTGFDINCASDSDFVNDPAYASIFTSNKKRFVPRNLIIKLSRFTIAFGDLNKVSRIAIRDKHRHFMCMLSRAGNQAAYDRLYKMITEGVGRVAIHLVAELKAPNELMIKVSEKLAEQPW